MKSIESPIIHINGLSCTFREQHIFSGIMFDIHESDICLLRGPSGSGKSTLQRMIAGIEPPQLWSVEYHLEGKTLDTTDRQFCRLYQKYIGIFSTESVFFENNTVLQNILFPSMFWGYFFDKMFSDQLIRLFEIEKLLDSALWDISSGERDRVSLIRMLVSRPRIIFLDEPFSHLDSRMYQIVVKSFHDYVHQIKPTVFLISHDQNITFPHAREFILDDRKLIES